jgi:hypothetical protein
VTVALVLVASVVSVQAHPDFTGRWTLDAQSPAPTDAARVLVVDWQVMRPTVPGELRPRPLVYLHISVRREGTSGTTTETYPFGLTGGLVGPRLDSNERRAAWREDTLTLLTRRDGPDGPHTGEWSERSESWSLDSDGRLRVEIVTDARDHPHQATVLLYRRE